MGLMSRNPFNGPSISRRLVFFILLYSSLITLLATATQLYVDYRSDLDILERRLRQVEISYVNGIKDDLWNMDQKQVRVHLLGILNLPEMEALILKPADAPTIEVGLLTTDRLMTKNIPLDFRHKGATHHLGDLQIHASLEGIYNRLKKKVFVVLITQAVKTFLVIAFMLILFDRMLFRHLGKIAGFAQNFTLKDLDRFLRLDRKAVAKNKGDELDQVVSALNQMQGALRLSYQELLKANTELEERKRELEDHGENLERLVDERTRKLKEAERTLLEHAHSAGMAEVAIGILHHIGNTLNSLNISSHLLAAEVQGSCLSKLLRANALLDKNLHRLAEFIRDDPKGEQLLRYYLEVGRALKEEQKNLLSEIDKIHEHLNLIKNAISYQREYARGGSYQEEIDLGELVEEVVKLEASRLEKGHIRIRKNFQEIPHLIIPPNKVRYVILNLLKNAREAIQHQASSHPLIEIRIGKKDEKTMLLSIRDNGSGIASDQLISIFKMGFSTKPDSHGFSLHACANAMTEIGGSLKAESAGVGKGAVFTMVLPLKGAITKRSIEKMRGISRNPPPEKPS